MGLRTKKVAQVHHARKRAAERYGLWLRPSDLDRLVEQIQSGRGRHVEKQSNRVSLWEVQVESEHYTGLALVVYDRMRKQIVSFLPPREGKTYSQEAADAAEEQQV